MKAYFDEQANQWDTEYRIKRARRISDEIKKRVLFEPNNKVLEFGCGTGLISMNLVDGIQQITCVDNSEGMLSILKNKIDKELKEEKFIVENDLFSENINKESFDGIYSSMALHHVKDIEKIGVQFNNLLKTNGKLCIVDLMPDDGTFHRNEPDFDGHNGFDPKELSGKYAKLGFREGYKNVFFSDVKKSEEKDFGYSLFILVMFKEEEIL